MARGLGQRDQPLVGADPPGRPRPLAAAAHPTEELGPSLRLGDGALVPAWLLRPAAEPDWPWWNTQSMVCSRVDWFGLKRRSYWIPIDGMFRRGEKTVTGSTRLADSHRVEAVSAGSRPSRQRGAAMGREQQQGTAGRDESPAERALVAALLEASETLGSRRSVSQPIRDGMVERQKLGRRSLRSSVRMSGPVK